MNLDFFDHRQNYSLGELREEALPADPLMLMQQWIAEAVNRNHPEPLAFVLATVGTSGIPSSRVVLLKQLTDKGLIFFSNYKSRKGEEIELNRQVAALFFWPLLERQLRVEGEIEKTPDSVSDSYFNERPEESRLAAIISPQSQPIPSRQWLEQAFKEARKNLQEIRRPAHWGGYLIVPHRIEFWQGRPNRLHDRIVYQLRNDRWERFRLAP